MSETIAAERIEATDDGLVVVFTDSQVRIPWAKCSPRLAAASPEERRHAELAPGGYGVHWKLLDLDLSVRGLARAAHSV